MDNRADFFTDDEFRASRRLSGGTSVEGDASGAPHPDASSYAKKFSGKYSRRIIKGGVGHNLPQEALHAFAEAIVEVAEV
jgi:hypothetical protein